MQLRAHQIWHFYCFSGGENIPMDGNLFDKKTKFYAVHREKIAPVLFRKWAPRRNWKYVNTMSTKELKTEYAGGDNMCTCAVFFAKILHCDISSCFGLLQVHTLLCVCLWEIRLIGRLLHGWVAVFWGRKHSRHMRGIGRNWLFVCLCLSGTTTGCPKKTHFENAIGTTVHWLNHN